MHSIIEQLKLHEGFRSKPYKDTEGYLTIGFGRNLDAKGISKEEGEYLLMNDLDEAFELLFDKPYFNKLSEVRKKVLLDMAYNLGSKFFQFKKMIAALKEDNYDKAADEMLDSLWAEQVGKRAKRLALMMRTGEDYND